MAVGVGFAFASTVTAVAEGTPADSANSKEGTSEQSGSKAGKSEAQGGQTAQVFDIFEFRVDGADHLQQTEVEAAVLPFLGLNRTSQDVDKARAAVEKAYHDKGLQTVVVSVPQQNVEGGTVVLTVN